jgi:CRISPR-associated protein Csx17
MLTLLKRRVMDAERLHCKSLPLSSPIRVTPEDVAAFLSNDGIDDSRIEDLMFACTLIDAETIDREVANSFAEADASTVEAVIPRSYALLKHLFHPKKEWAIRPEPAILSLLATGRTQEACEIAQRQLRVSGFRPVNSTFPDEPEGIRLAASLLIPIHSMDYLSRLVLHEKEEVAL